MHAEEKLHAAENEKHIGQRATLASRLARYADRSSIMHGFNLVGHCLAIETFSCVLYTLTNCSGPTLEVLLKYRAVAVEHHV